MTFPTRAIDTLKPAELVEKCGISRSYASELIGGHRTPSLDVAVRIESHFGIPAAAWIENRGAKPGAAA